MSIQRCTLSASATPDSLQLHSCAHWQALQQGGPLEPEWIRFESVRCAGKTQLRIDVLLSSPVGSAPLLGLIWDDGLTFPSLGSALAPELLQRLQELARFHVARSPQQHEMRPLTERPRLSAEEIHSGNPLPGAWDYASLLPRIERLRALLAPRPDVLCCRDDSLGPWHESDDATLQFLSQDTASSPLFRFQAPQPISTWTFPSDKPRIACMDLLAEVRDPEAWLRDIAARLPQDGILHLSVPLENAPRTPLSRPLQSLWNYRRLEALVGDVFSEVALQEIPSTWLEEHPSHSLLATLSAPRDRKRNRIVVRRGFAMGDVLWTTPILRQLRQEHPGSRIAVTTRCMEVFRGNPDVDQVLAEPFEPSAADHLIDLDLAYERRRSLHLLDAYAQEAGIVPSQLDPVFFPEARDLEATRSLFLSHFPRQGIDHLVALHMAASSPDRIWPSEAWKETILSLLDRQNIGIVLVGSGNDFSLGQLDLPSSPRLLDLVRSQDLSGTAASLAWCDALLCMDSGLSHLAAAVSTPPIVLFNMALPETRLPFRTRSRGLLVDAHCRGCLEHLPPHQAPYCRYGKSTCLESITPNAVLQALGDILSGVAAGSWSTRMQAGRGRVDPVPAGSPPLPPQPPLWIRLLKPLRPLVTLVQNHRNRALWAAHKDLRL